MKIIFMLCDSIQLEVLLTIITGFAIIPVHRRSVSYSGFIMIAPVVEISWITTSSQKVLPKLCLICQLNNAQRFQLHHLSENSNYPRKKALFEIQMCTLPIFLIIWLLSHEFQTYTVVEVL